MPSSEPAARPDARSRGIARRGCHDIDLYITVAPLISFSQELSKFQQEMSKDF
jgi:hypothetical protein